MLLPLENTNRLYSFDRQPQLSKKNIVENTEHSTLDSILLAVTCVSSVQQYMPVFPKKMLFPTENAAI
jgi:hypothetical protein